jgi:hypothetical protein
MSIIPATWEIEMRIAGSRPVWAKLARDVVSKNTYTNKRSEAYSLSGKALA